MRDPTRETERNGWRSQTPSKESDILLVAYEPKLDSTDVILVRSYPSGNEVGG
jgi:hypothetical protein